MVYAYASPYRTAYRRSADVAGTPFAMKAAWASTMGFAHGGTYAEVGFKLGSWRDVGWGQCRIASDPPCGAPIAFRNLRET